MAYHLPHPLTLDATDFDTWSRAHSRITEALEALAQCRLSFNDFCAGAPNAEAAFSAWSDAHAECLSALAHLHAAQAYTEAWANQALGQLDPAVSCAEPLPPSTPLPVSLH